MSNAYQSPIAFAGRLLMALLFLPAGLSKMAGFAGTVAYIGSVGLPLPQLGAVIAIVLEAGGGLALILGYQTRLVALGLALFTLVAGALFHNFWAAAPEQLLVQQIMFFKNVAIAGGLLMMTAFGPGSWSLDARRSA
jgi:putative oxidoreductase